MKLILAIVNNDDSAVVSTALTKENFAVTKLTTTGGFLMVGNTTLLIGTEDDKVSLAKEVIKKHCQKRTQSVPSNASFGRGLADGELAESVTVGGATIFVLDVAETEKY